MVCCADEAMSGENRDLTRLPGRPILSLCNRYFNSNDCSVPLIRDIVSFKLFARGVA